MNIDKDSLGEICSKMDVQTLSRFMQSSKFIEKTCRNVLLKKRKELVTREMDNILDGNRSYFWTVKENQMLRRLYT